MLPPLPNFLLESQIAVVTGGGSGIGRAVALAFAAAGARVVVLDAHEAAASQVADELGTSGQAIVADVRDAEAIERAFASVALRYGHVDVLFNNAGINRRRPSLELTLDDWNAVVAVNMTGMHHVGTAHRAGRLRICHGRCPQRHPGLEGTQLLDPTTTIRFRQSSTEASFG